MNSFIRFKIRIIAFFYAFKEMLKFHQRYIRFIKIRKMRLKEQQNEKN